MAADIPEVEPVEFAAGDTVKWTRAIDDYSAADGWTLTYYLRGANSATITATQDGTSSRFSVTVATTVTDDWPAGDYELIAYVSKAGERFQIYRERLVITKNLAAETGTYEVRTDAEIILAALIQLQKDRATRPEVSYSIQAAGRSFNFKSDKEIIEAIQFWQGEVVKEDPMTTSGTGKNIFVRFNTP